MQSLESQSRPLIILRILTGGIGIAILFICLLLLALLDLHTGTRALYLAMKILIPLGVLAVVASALGNPWLGFATGAGLITVSTVPLFIVGLDVHFLVAFLVFSAAGAGILWSAARILPSTRR
jgi:hypothetical protein